MCSRHSTNACPGVPRTNGHNLRDSEKGCNPPGVQPGVELGSTSKDIGGGRARASCLLARAGAWSGPQANGIVWERSLLEPQVAELPATKPFCRTERAHERAVQGTPGSLQLGLQVTPLQGQGRLSLQHIQIATARRTDPFQISHPGPHGLSPQLGRCWSGWAIPQLLFPFCLGCFPRGSAGFPLSEGGGLGGTSGQCGLSPDRARHTHSFVCKFSLF